MADLQTVGGRITHTAGSRIASRNPQGDDSSPGIKTSRDRESDSRAKITDQDGAEQSSPATSSPAASSPETASTPEDQSPTQTEDDVRCLEGLGHEKCSDSQQMECGARSDSRAMQAADKGHRHSSAAAASDPVPSLAAVHAVPALAAVHAVPALAADNDAGSNMGCLAAQAHAGNSDAEAMHALEVQVKPDTSVSMSAPICNSHETPFSENRHGIMMGKRKRARKSTKSEHQPANSFQQSNANLLQSADSMLKTNNTALFSDIDTEAARDSSSNKPCAVNMVIDLT